MSGGKGGMPLPVLKPKDVKGDRGKWLIHGEQGSGKTTLASTIAECGKTLFVDLIGEKGTRGFAGASYEDNIDIVRPTSITQLDDLFWWLAAGDHDYVAVILDSLTALQKMAMRYLLDFEETSVREIRKGGKPASRQTWGQSLDIMTDTATFWYGLADEGLPQPMHVVMTSQTKFFENEDTGETRRAIDVQKGALSIVLASPDYVLYTDVEDNIDAVTDDTLPPVRHIVRFGSHPGYRTKARLPVNLRGKVPSILGRRKPANLTDLSRVLGIGGVPRAAAK